MSIKQGLILIPDITGYTAFVHHAKLEHSERTISNLLQSLIDTAPEWLDMCEIEGDAILFFKFGPSPDFQTLYAQIKRWFGAFHETLATMVHIDDCGCEACQEMANLTLKVIGHYGEIGILQVGDIRKLIGSDVILAHRLLKNQISEREYFLLTDILAESAKTTEWADIRLRTHEENYPVYGQVSLKVLDLAPLLPNPAPN